MSLLGISPGNRTVCGDVAGRGHSSRRSGPVPCRDGQRRPDQRGGPRARTSRRPPRNSGVTCPVGAQRPAVIPAGRPASSDMSTGRALPGEGTETNEARWTRRSGCRSGPADLVRDQGSGTICQATSRVGDGSACTSCRSRTSRARCGEASRAAPAGVRRPFRFGEQVLQQGCVLVGEPGQVRPTGCVGSLS